MRSEHPIPGNPWPHDMVISVDEKPRHILELLFIRSVWGLAADARIPPLDPAPLHGNSSRPPPGASRSGLRAGNARTIITLPYPGYFADRISRTHLAVSNATRTDPSWYTRAPELR